MNRIVCLSRPVVKPSRRTARPSAPFGAGLLRSLPSYRADHSADDAAWWAAEQAAAEDRHLDALAAESEAQDRYERGCLL
jgi:hypothetical protein